MCCTFLIALCFFIYLRGPSFICVVLFYLRCAFFLFALCFFIWVVLFCLRFGFLFSLYFPCVCLVLQNLRTVSCFKPFFFFCIVMCFFCLCFLFLFVLGFLPTCCIARRPRGHALAIDTASHVYHEKRVAWSPISTFTCCSLPIFMVLYLAALRATGAPLWLKRLGNDCQICEQWVKLLYS